MGVERITVHFKMEKKQSIPNIMAGDGGLQKLKEQIRF